MKPNGNPQDYLGKILMSVRAEKQDIIGGNSDMETSDSIVSTGVETD